MNGRWSGCRVTAEVPRASRDRRSAPGGAAGLAGRGRRFCVGEGRCSAFLRLSFLTGCTGVIIPPFRSCCEE